jgi:hypothetical protein
MEEYDVYMEFFEIPQTAEDKRRAMIEMFKTIIDDDTATVEEKLIGINNFVTAYFKVQGSL